MKNYNKILEAIDRGIQLALDDYEDDAKRNFDTPIYKEENQIKPLLTDYVDMGFPSRTLWAKYNLGVNTRYLNETNGEWYGDYYAWGETELKNHAWDNYSWDNYKFGKEEALTKYCDDPFHGKPDPEHKEDIDYKRYYDYLKTLLQEDDIATKKLGKGFHIPTYNQVEELVTYTSFKEKLDYNGIKGLNGIILVSNINGNSIFIPATGCKTIADGIKDNRMKCYFWSSSLASTEYAYSFVYSITNIPELRGTPPTTQWHARFEGLPIRPVYDL